MAMNYQMAANNETARNNEPGVSSSTCNDRPPGTPSYTLLAT
jgi:hypothetical protein